MDQVLNIASQDQTYLKKTRKCFKVSKKIKEIDGKQRPGLSYNQLIIEAIKKSEYGMLSLQEIYEYIQDKYSFFKDSTMVS